MQTDQPETETKGAFAARVGVSPGRVSQWIRAGLPLTADGKRVRVAEALAWLSSTLDPSQVAAQRRAKPTAPAPPAQLSLLAPTDDDGADDEEPGAESPADLIAAKTEHEWLKVERARLLLEQTRENLAPWAEVNTALDAWARAERDAWMAWASRIVPALAAEIKVEGATLAPALRRAVEDHIRALADGNPPHVGP